ncbi:DUF2153 family protein [Candidatus Bathyarchaeota archaeon]|nr:DUF2153 family protein [Candidatus Bathyarchaeota archaeon]MBS7627826.1 DUF2153 family protein [Candidatus Bathyarchaeota archaeon]
MSSAFYRYIEYLLREQKNLEEKVNTMSKAELVSLGRSLVATYEESLRGFDGWFTNFYIMDKMEEETLKDIVRNLISIGFQLLKYDRDITKAWYEMEMSEKKRMAEEEAKKKTASSIV